MTRADLIKLFNEIKELAALDYAIVDTDEYGDCNTCVNDELTKRYGISSKGIYLKHWQYGINAGVPLEELDEIYIAHDLTYEQGEKLFDYLKGKFTLENSDYSPLRAFVIKLQPVKS